MVTWLAPFLFVFLRCVLTSSLARFVSFPEIQFALFKQKFQPLYHHHQPIYSHLYLNFTQGMVELNRYDGCKWLLVFATCCLICCVRKQPNLQKLQKSHLIGFFFFMNWWNMFIHLTLWRTAVFTNFTFQWLFSFMNQCNMFIHVTLLITVVVTNITTASFFHEPLQHEY